ncbi:hypothetical protein BT63DRAFT_467486 [Microthyrium microscopicum]|uniref:Altered inheritance of mitochondria protein 6 n=1 Tax=Microthyrium microscopicum TaxID=703497 RepID=A0A6A6UR24_9PEZI|nr:hypothetical protein BT63DRAFT_467486 [Microthyrium microscopicum]
MLSILSWALFIAPIFADILSPALQIILSGAGKDQNSYPSDFTRDIAPKPIHSHNDYWRDVPYYSALSVGAVSVEADVWLVNGTLYVGHELAALSSARTLSSLYIQPILDTLKRQNPSTPFTSSSSSKNGVYDTSSGQTLYLWIDVKTDGPTTWSSVLSALAPLKDGGWLTTTDGKTVKPGTVTVIGTGNTPFSYFSPTDPASSASPRYTFYDAPLATLQNTNITSLISPIASTDFAAVFGPVVNDGPLGSAYPIFNGTQLATLRKQLSAASSRGIGARYWDQPLWPVGTRDAVWRLLLDEGVALLNVDDLNAAANLN